MKLLQRLQASVTWPSLFCRLFETIHHIAVTWTNTGDVDDVDGIQVFIKSTKHNFITVVI